MISHEIPTVEEELTRKTIETYEWIIERASTAQMSESEVRVAVQTIFNVTCGLVPKDITEQAELLEANADAKAVLKRVFFSTEKTIGITWNYGDNDFLVTSHAVNGEAKKQTVTMPDPRAALQKLHEVATMFLNKGYKEI